MKNNITIFSVLLLLACSIIISSGCNKNNPADTVMTDNTETATSNSSSDAADTEDVEDASVIIDDESSYKISRNDCTTFINPQGFGKNNPYVYLQGIVEITNTGKTDLELSAGSCDINKDGEPFLLSEIFTGYYPQIISPGEKGYYYFVKATDNAVLDGNYIIIPNISVIKTTFSNIRLDVTESSLTQDIYGRLMLKGRVQNNTQDDQTGITVVAVLFDSNDKPINFRIEFLDESISPDDTIYKSITLSPGDEINFEAMGFEIPDTITPDSVARYEVYAYPYQYSY